MRTLHPAWTNMAAWHPANIAGQNNGEPLANRRNQTDDCARCTVMFLFRYPPQIPIDSQLRNVLALIEIAENGIPDGGCPR
jgi:hypothetical protein